MVVGILFFILMFMVTLDILFKIKDITYTFVAFIKERYYTQRFTECNPSASTGENLIKHSQTTCNFRASNLHQNILSEYYFFGCENFV